jgi:hypothetical protein
MWSSAMTFFNQGIVAILMKGGLVVPALPLPHPRGPKHLHEHNKPTQRRAHRSHRAL